MLRYADDVAVIARNDKVQKRLIEAPHMMRLQLNRKKFKAMR